jgi:hypothetical protein
MIAVLGVLGSQFFFFWLSESVAWNARAPFCSLSCTGIFSPSLSPDKRVSHAAHVRVASEEGEEERAAVATGTLMAAEVEVAAATLLAA